MKLRRLCIAVVLFAVAGAAQAADTGNKGDASETAAKKLTIPSVKMGGGSIGISGRQPNDPNVPALNDPEKQDKPIEPYFGLKFTEPLGGK